MLYVALGDSITAGEVASSPAKAYPSLVVQGLYQRAATVGGQNARGRAQVFQNAVLAEPGWTSQALLTVVREQSPSVLANARAISVFIGGDNLVAASLAMLRGAGAGTLKTSLVTYGQSLRVLITAIHQVSRAQVIVCTQYNPFPNSPIAVEGISALNEVITHTAASCGATVAPVHAWFEGNQPRWIGGYRTGTLRDALTGEAPVHPNNRGHRAIAAGLVPLIQIS